MAIGPVGNAIFVNQQTPAVASIKADHIARIDFQNMAAQHIVNEEEKHIQEVRPTEENHQIDPDREHQRQEAEQNTQKQSSKNNEEQNEEETPPLHHLDITV